MVLCCSHLSQTSLLFVTFFRKQEWIQLQFFPQKGRVLTISALLQGFPTRKASSHFLQCLPNRIFGLAWIDKLRLESAGQSFDKELIFALYQTFFAFYCHNFFVLFLCRCCLFRGFSWDWFSEAFLGINRISLLRLVLVKLETLRLCGFLWHAQLHLLLNVGRHV